MADAAPSNGTPAPTPLDAEAPAPSTPTPRGRGARQAAGREIPQGHEQVTTRTTIRPARGSSTEAPALAGAATPPPIGRTPLDLDAAVETSMVEVERVGPGSGPGWQGRRYNGQDVYYGRMGRLPKTDRIYDDAQSRFGGGEYEFRGFGSDGKALTPQRKRWGSAPLPPDNLDTDPMGGLWGQPGFGLPGTFPQYPQGFQQPFGAFGPGAPSPLYMGMTDPQGFIPPVESQSVGGATAGLHGWVFSHGANAWKWIQPPGGSPYPPGPPPAHPSQQGQGGFAPWNFDHSRKDDDRVARLERMVEKLVERADRPPSDPMAGLATMMKAQLDADRLRWDQERAAADRRWEQEKADRDRQTILSERVATAQAEAQKEIVRLQTDAQKETAKVMADSSREQQKLVLETLKGSNPIAAAKGLADAVGMPLFGGGKSEAAELTQAVSEGIKSGAEGIAEIFRVWKGAPSGSGAPGGVTEEQQKGYDQFRLLGLMLRLYEMGVPPAEMPRHITVACMTLNLELEPTLSQIRLASPDVMAAQIEKQISGKAVSDAVKAQVANAREVILSEGGRKWIEGVRAVLRAGQPSAVGAAPPPAQIPVKK